MEGSVDKKAIDELLPFLDENARQDVKYFALDYIVGLTGSEDGKLFMRNHKEFVRKVTKLTRDSSATCCSKAWTAVVNLSAEIPIAEIILENEILEDFVLSTLDPKNEDADKSACILMNLTRTEQGSQKLFKDICSSQKCDFNQIVAAFCKVDHNPKANLNYLAPMFSNLTQLKDVRDMMLDRSSCVVQKLLPFTGYEDSSTRRGGVVATLKNCCFDTEHHEWLLSDAVDILPHLLLPLAGGEELDEDDMDKLPVDLQYLDANKQREKDPDIRKILVEALTQLCATPCGRKVMRDKNVYVILREFHNWEKDEEVSNVCLNLIEILISDEPEKGMENLKEVVIPEDFKIPES
ncbi:hypothetical protein QZH41_013257 [Actinostola sp. cb2023]|nr:hypothetical protein QZH41_013257 [Actinostola sp. cb2023]